MLQSASTLLDWRGISNPADPVAAFREHLYDTQLIFDPFTGGHFAQHFFRAAGLNGGVATPDVAEGGDLGEAQLFIEASFAAYGRSKSLPKLAAAWMELALTVSSFWARLPAWMQPSPRFTAGFNKKSLDQLLIDVVDYRHVPDGPGVGLNRTRCRLRIEPHRPDLQPQDKTGGIACGQNRRCVPACCRGFAASYQALT